MIHRSVPEGVSRTPSEAHDKAPRADLEGAGKPWLQARLATLPPGDCLVTPPLSPALVGEGEGREWPWVVESEAPDWTEALTQLSLGACGYHPISKRFLDDLPPSEASPSEPVGLSSAALEAIFHLFDGEGASPELEADRLLEKVARYFSAEGLALLVAGEPPRSVCLGPERHLQAVKVVSCAGGAGGGRLVLGRLGSASAEEMRGWAPEVTTEAMRLAGRLLLQHRPRWELFSRVLQAKREWESTVDAIREPMVVLDGQGRVARANMALAELLQQPIRQVVGRPIHQLVGLPPGDRWWDDAREEAVERQLPVAPERTYLIQSSAPAGRTGLTFVHLRDVTEERRLASLVKQRERFAALGELADGIFHDLSNMAASLRPDLHCAQEVLPSLHKQLSLAKVKPSGALERDLTDLKESLEGAVLATAGLEQLVSLLRFFRSGSGEGDPGSLLEVPQLLQALPVLYKARARRRGVSLKLEVQAVPPVKARAAELMRVFDNLLRNAMEALPGGGTITLRVKRDGQWVRVEVQDSGPGIPESLEERIFERGFTTKGAHGGTGLGLFMCRELLSGIGGQLRVTRPLEGGACFVVDLPATPR